MVARTDAVKVRLSEPTPETPEILAEAITRIGSAVAKLNKNGVNREAVVVLMRDYTGLPKKTIVAVLNALPQLERAYCR
jgi:hypothetical protein